MRVTSWAALSAAAAVIGLAALAATGPTGANAALAASFDCGKAATATEHAICANANLSNLDSALGLAYGQRLALDPAIRQIERGWLAVRNVGCGGDVGCLTGLTGAQLAWLRAGAPRPPGAMPIRVGACSLTTISKVGTRLEGVPESGSAIEEADGASQVSYDRIAAIGASRSGDPALVCLVSLPQDCPPGDERGKVYGVANLRTLGAWSQPDAEHLCGGA
jgi:uncharacterized protein